MIRPIRPWEIGPAMKLAQEFHDIAGLGTTFSPTRFLQTVDSMAQSGFLFFTGMFAKDELVGLLIGTISPQMMTDTRVAQEVMWYVHPDHRGNTEGIRLLLDFEAWAKKHGADGIIMASFAAAGEEKLAKFYERSGYLPLETHVIKRF